MVRVGLTKLRALSPAELDLLSDEERGRQFGSPHRRSQYRCGRSLLRLLLSIRTGIPAPEQPIEVLRGGKPVCVGGPAVSITHADNLVACCISDAGQIGMDLQPTDARRPTRQIARCCFSDEEIEWLGGQGDDRFFMLWVLKEAYGKATGEGVCGGLKQLRCRVEPPRIQVTATQTGPRFFTLYHDGRNFLALAATGDPDRRRRDRILEAGNPGTIALRTVSADSGRDQCLSCSPCLRVAVMS